MAIKQMKEEGCFNDYRNRITDTGANMIMLVQITRPLKKAHKHIPDSILLIALRFVFQIIDCNKWIPLYFPGLFVYFERKCFCCQIKPMRIQARFLFEIILYNYKSFACSRFKL